MSEQPNRYKGWESAARRPMAAGVWHPDQCERLTLQGVNWGIQPLTPPKGVRVRPQIGGGGVTLQVQIAEQEHPAGDGQLAKLADLIRAEAPISEGKPCPTCGQPQGGLLEIDLDGQQEFLCRLVNYAVYLLRQQYELTDEQLGELFAFDGESLPPWVGQIIRHVYGLSTDSATAPAAPEFDPAWLEMFAQPAPAEPQPVPSPRRPWWRLWER